MDGLFIFDHQNDVIYTKYNDEMKMKIFNLAKQQELVQENATEDEYLSSNVIIQLFSPIITSQRMMLCQFDNSYTALQLENDLNVIFDEFLGYIFIKIGTKPVEWLQRSVGVCSAFIKRLCGADVQLLKLNPAKADLLTNLLNTWSKLYDSDQAILIEAVDHLLVNLELKNLAQKTLELATESLKQDPHSQKSHAFLFVKNKFLAKYSSKQAQTLAPCDILFLSIFYQCAEIPESKRTQSHLLFLQGQVSDQYSGCIPYICHIANLDHDLVLLLLVEYGSLPVASSLYDIFYTIYNMQLLQMQNDLDSLRPTFERFDVYVKHAQDALKRAKFNNQDVDAMCRKFVSKWEFLRKKYLELFKNCDKNLIVGIESNLPSFVDIIKDIFRLTCVECPTLENGLQRVIELSAMVEGRLLEFSEFLHVKAERNFTMESYFEDFPGMIHFIYIDRTVGRIIAPNVDIMEKPIISKQKIWSMIEFTRSYLQKGHMAVMWKDTAFCYSYFVWFEDSTGASVKPKELPNATAATSIRPQVVPGILAGEFYQWLIDTCFPKCKKVKCFELYTVHLGLASATCVLEHNRRLAATIMEDAALPTGILDIQAL